MTFPVLKVSNLSVENESAPVLSNITFEVLQSDRVAIVGPNGAGKSSLLKALLGLDIKSWGEIKYWGQSLDQQRNRVAWVPQIQEVDWDFPLTVKDVVLQGRYPKLGLFKSPSVADFKVVEESLKTVGMWDLRLRPISQLSGGQKQRMFLARSLAQEADLFLLDEPTAGLDAKSEDHFMGYLKELSEMGKTFVVVHHNLYSVKKHFNKALLVNLISYGYGETASTLNTTQLELAYSGATPK
jgi:manganese/zinc/iron transport system ATP- binding protein